MTIEIERKSDRLDIIINCKDITSENEISKTFDHLINGLQIISDHLNERDIYFFGLIIKGDKPFLSRLLPKFNNGDGKKYLKAASDEFSKTWARASSGCYNPWEAICPDFWLNALKMGNMLDRIKLFNETVEQLLIAANQSNRSTDSLWEHDETQFGEALATLLALHTKEFVPFYSTLLNKWDMGHEVKQKHEIKNIVLKYGVCSETTDLLYTRAFDVDAQWHVDQIEELLPILNSKSDNFYESDAFDKIISGFHLGLHHKSTKAFETYKSDIDKFNAELAAFKSRANPKASDMPPRQPYEPRLYTNENIFEYWNDSELKFAAEKILEKYEKQYPDPNFSSISVATL